MNHADGSKFQSPDGGAMQMRPPPKAAQAGLMCAAPTAPAAEPQDAVGNAQRDLGQLDGLGEKFYRAAGAVADTLAPKNGMYGHVRLDLNIPITPPGAATASVAITANGEVERDQNKTRVRADFRLGVLGKVDAVLFKAFMKVQGLGYVEGNGDDGAEAFRLISLALYKAVQDESKKAAALLWGDSAQETLVAPASKEMDDADYGESGLGFDVSMGFGAGKTNAKKEVGGSYTSTKGTRYKKSGKDVQGTPTAMQSLELSAGPFSGAIKGELDNGAWQKIDAEFGAEAPLKALTNGKEMGTFLRQAKRYLPLGMGPSVLTMKQVGAAVDLVSDKLGGLAPSLGKTGGKLAKTMGDLGSAGVKFVVSLERNGKGFSVRGRVMATEKIEKGTPDDPVHLLIEASQTVFDTAWFAAGGGK